MTELELNSTKRRVASMGDLPIGPHEIFPRKLDAFNYTVGLQCLVRSLPRLGIVVEVGSYRGVSTECFSLMCDKVIAVDHWGSGDCPTWTDFSAMMNARRNVSALRMFSVEAARLFGDKSIDLVYIDASHDYVNVKNDIDAWLPKSKRLAGHDFLLADVAQAVSEKFGDKIDVFDDSSWLARS